MFYRFKTSYTTFVTTTFEVLCFGALSLKSCKKMTSKDTAVPLWIEGEAQSAGSKGESSSSSNKPRFVPKIPVKKEKTAAVVVENGT